MEYIIRLLKSSLIWTIIGVVASCVGLWFAFADAHKSSSLCLSTGFAAMSEMDEGDLCVIANIVFLPYEVSNPVLTPIAIAPSNFGNETVENVGMRLYYKKADDYNWAVTNRLAEKPYELSMVYQKQGDKFIPVPTGGGVQLEELSPKSVAGSDYEKGGLFTPVVFKKCGASEAWEHRYEVEIKGDNSDISRYKLRVYNIPVYLSDNQDELNKQVNDALDYMSAKIKDIEYKYYNIVPCFAGRIYDAYIDSLAFMVSKPDIENIKSYKSGKK